MNNRKEHTEKFALNMLGYMFATLGVVILISMLMG
jgi:hypothetical protein